MKNNQDLMTVHVIPHLQAAFFWHRDLWLNCWFTRIQYRSYRACGKQSAKWKWGSVVPVQPVDCKTTEWYTDLCILVFLIHLTLILK